MWKFEHQKKIFEKILQACGLGLTKSLYVKELAPGVMSYSSIKLKYCKGIVHFSFGAQTNDKESHLSKV